MTVRYAGWILSIAMPLVAWAGLRYLPVPGSLLLAGTAIGLFLGVLLYEHTLSRQNLPGSVIYEQLLVGVIILAVLAGLT